MPYEAPAAGTITNFEDVELDNPDRYLASGTFSVDRMLACRQFLFPGAEPVYDDDRLEEENGKETDSDEDES